MSVMRSVTEVGAGEGNRGGEEDGGGGGVGVCGEDGDTMRDIMPSILFVQASDAVHSAFVAPLLDCNVDTRSKEAAFHLKFRLQGLDSLD